jgi:hypothetical protein
VGDTVAVKAASGERTLRISGLVLVPTVGGADALGETGLVTEQGFLTLDPSATLSVAAIRVPPGAGPGAAGRIAALAGSRDAGRGDPPPAIVNLRRVRAMPMLIVGAVGFLGVLSLGHLMIVTVRRRRLDHAILRAVGATPRWLAAVVHWQATITTVVVIAVAIPVGTAGGLTIYRQFVDRVGARTDATVPFLWLGAALLALLALANLAAAAPARTSRHKVATAVLTGG